MQSTLYVPVRITPNANGIYGPACRGNAPSSRPVRNGGTHLSSAYPTDSQARHPPRQLHKLEPPPKFYARELSLWNPNLTFRGDIYSGIPDEKLLAAIGLKEDPEMKELLFDHYRENPQCVSSLAVEGFYKAVARDYGGVSEFT